MASAAQQRKYFGTDGIRGRVGRAPITPDFMLKLGWAAGVVFARGRALVGKDTRVSGYMIESALEAGLSAAGVDIGLLGPLPTPGIAYLTRTLHASGGIVISASHNPYYDNGIKIFGGDGFKLSDREEAEIERLLDAPFEVVPPDQLGKAVRIEDAVGRYVEFCKGTVPSGFNLEGLTIVVDCAHGAAYDAGPKVYAEMGARVIPIGVSPDGFNINADCGALRPQALQQAVREHNADLGVAIDGDGDRLIMADEQGDVVDGDELLAIIADFRQRNGALQGGIVGTQMTNMGFERAMRARGIEFKRANIGDRHVMEALLAHGWHLGGETSGHIICLDKSVGGDAIVASLAVIEALAGRPLSAARRVIEKHPQALVNVPVNGDFDLSDARIAAALSAARAALSDKGRVLVRPSGTEPLVRVMVESESERLSHLWAQRLAEEVIAAFGDGSKQA